MKLGDNLQDKLMSPAEAVRRFVQSGAQVALGGFTVNRNPMTLAYEIIRQGIGDLHIVCHSHGQALDLLIGAGCVRRLEIAYGAMGRFTSTCVRFRKALQNGEIEFEDYSNNQMSLRFLAGALGIPFIPSRSGLQTDIVTQEGFSRETRREAGIPRKKLLVAKNPFSEEEEDILLLPALNPDVALIHAQYVGDDGTVRIKGLTFADVEQAKSAGAVVVTCEDIVPRHFIRLDPDQNTLPPFLVNAVVRVPYGAHPTGCRFFYDYDPGHLKLYREAARDDDTFKEYLGKWVYGVENHDAYLDLIGGAALMRIKANPVLGYTPGLDRT